jgi:hypothetical protein
MRVNQSHALVGEIDFAIVNPAGNLLLIEQKSGFLGETPEGLVRQYDKTEKRVPEQTRATMKPVMVVSERAAQTLMSRLNESPATTPAP